MDAIKVQAIYRRGVLEPEKNLDLPEDTLVQLQVTPLSEGKSAPGSLFGAFPELAGFGEEHLAWARRLWEHGVEKQSRLLDDLE